ncbi:exonuclease domain-containing protein [Leifsonia sp. Leaf264]|uniref:exonuclease domain-containing protein n=1 Tax=Leifsonia sp. Leaf264 TaxID=1736314 RepID=UPI0006F99AA8|nr:exonuclease domain-containing protein [Leifsonia sp. Leaf264]KQO98800.1 hypothetical protein ASF30_12115 [Leifsonia sp. Leaf264]
MTKRNTRRISELDRLTVFDTETTGVNDTDRIVTAYIATIDRAGNVLEEHNFLLNPEMEIPQVAIDVHGVTNDIARTQGTNHKEGVAEITRLLKASSDAGIPITAFNGAFDVSITHRDAKRHGLDGIEDLGTMIDPFIIDKKLDQFRKGPRKLSNICKLYDVNLENAHTADADAIGAGLVAWKMLDKVAEKEGDLTMDQLQARQTRWAAKQAASLQAYFRNKGAGNENIDWRWPLREGDAVNDLPYDKWYQAQGLTAPTQEDRDDRHAEMVSELNRAVAAFDPEFAAHLEDIDAQDAAKKTTDQNKKAAVRAAEEAEREIMEAEALKNAESTRAAEAWDAANALVGVTATPEQERLAGLWVEPQLDREIDEADRSLARMLTGAADDSVLADLIDDPEADAALDAELATLDALDDTVDFEEQGRLGDGTFTFKGQTGIARGAVPRNTTEHLSAAEQEARKSQAALVVDWLDADGEWDNDLATVRAAATDTEIDLSPIIDRMRAQDAELYNEPIDVLESLMPKLHATAGKVAAA